MSLLMLDMYISIRPVFGSLGAVLLFGLLLLS